jgi:uncharacterized membrane protein
VDQSRGEEQLNTQTANRGQEKRRGSLSFLWLAGVVVVTCNAAAQDSSAATPAKEISYTKDVSPIVEKFCATCHNADEDHPSQLFMDSYETLMTGGKHGKAVEPGNSKESLLLQKMSPAPPFGKKMPPSKKLIPTAGQIEILRQWIEQGAKKN